MTHVTFPVNKIAISVSHTMVQLEKRTEEEEKHAGTKLWHE